MSPSRQEEYVHGRYTSQPAAWSPGQVPRHANWQRETITLERQSASEPWIGSTSYRPMHVEDAGTAPQYFQQQPHLQAQYYPSRSLPEVYDTGSRRSYAAQASSTEVVHRDDRRPRYTNGGVNDRAASWEMEAQREENQHYQHAQREQWLRQFGSQFDESRDQTTSQRQRRGQHRETRRSEQGGGRSTTVDRYFPHPEQEASRALRDRKRR